MSETFQVVKNVIGEVCGIEDAKLTPQANCVDDLRIDSIDMLDIVYELNRRLKVLIPMEQWAEEISSGAAKTADYFVLERLAARIDALPRES
jgi:acyl carrier protein